VLVDVSEEALKIAKANSVRLGLGSSDTEFQAVSIFDFVANQKSFRKKFDIIVSNPPYIEVGDPNVEQSVQDFEPKVALFTEMSGYRFYDFYSKHAWDWLEDDGTLICEIGVGMETQISKMFSTLYWKELKFFKDTSGRTRVFSVSKK
jgi:release factor glutamine methyltransferase